jgi:O-antigen/teichoic acid export membrane protein
MNPFDSLATYFLGRIQQKVYQTWMRLLFQVAVSMAGSFLFIAGSIMVASVSKMPASDALVLGLGSGMVAAACVLVYYIRRDPNLKGMMFVFPEAEAEKELDSNMQVITKPDK